MQFWGYLFLSVFCKFSVPVFFMISGAVLLNREDEPLKQLWSHRVIPFFYKLLFISAIHASRMILRSEGISALRMMYSEGISYHLPFMYSYLAFLMSLPFLRKLVRQMEMKDFCYMLGIVLVFRLVPIAECFLWNGEVKLTASIQPSWLLSNIVLFPCLGYFLEYRIHKEEIGKLQKWLWPINMISIALCAGATAVQGRNSGVYSQTYLSNLVFINGMVLYLSAKDVFLRFHPSQRLCSAIAAAGDCAFGVYLFHPLFMKYVPNLMADVFAKNGTMPMLACWAYVLFIALLVAIIVYFLKKLPLLNKLL